MRKEFIIFISPILVSLVLIFLCIILSLDWFSLMDNALSDLGHAVRSPVAPVFNFALATSGVLIVANASIYVRRELDLLFMLVLLGYFLVLVAVFDEVYGVLHFIVAVLFFTALMAFTLLYARRLGRFILVATILIVLFNIAVWTAHFMYRYPRGVAIPELVSIFTAIPFYVHLGLRSLCRDSTSLDKSGEQR